MSILEFIFGLIVLSVSAFVIIGIFCTIYDDKKLEKENIQLKEDLKKAKLKKEYNNVKLGGKK